MTLDVRALSYEYAGYPPTLRDVEVSVPAGESHFILGPSGCGKTTLLRCIAGLLPSSGSVIVDGRDLSLLPVHRRRIGMMFQDPGLFPHLKVWQNVAFGMRYAGVARRDERHEAMRLLEQVELGEYGERLPDSLSGGQKQRVALARTLGAHPAAVLLDEPFSNLDRELRDILGVRVKQWLCAAQVPALWVTHDEADAGRLGDKVWRLVEGQLVAAVN